ncbi:MAG: phosphocholine cytidylyltransferase family protein [Myxococcales bacterium]|nr:phosphocholine cytidylyltransferase family protein [Myxococcales bacterium]
MQNTHTAVVLVAGIGTRLRPLTDDRPKALVDIGNETILGRALRLLGDHGVTHVVLATGYREEAVRSALTGSRLQVSFCRNERFDSTQNSLSLALCADAVAGRAFFKLDGDVVFRPEVLQRLDASDAELAVAVDRTRRTDAEAMKFCLGAGAEITQFGKALSLDAAAGESIGIERVGASASARLFAELAKPEYADLYYEDVYSRLIAAGRMRADAVDVGDLPWTEVDDPRDLERARQLFA